ncbi:unnamed protein product [Didymodactylos carnosus]|uniref:Uncharacterized protein n=1 Tax=Didymodactylos carnosus TaxID=1234261 RepID=A0A813XE32_9BILA|nr:unnamed protein product [Didymodactylos carnosus]CAF3656729.1 unnamed protein product [Didymodactylos carnosus]
MKTTKRHKFLMSEALLFRSCDKALREMVPLLKSLPLGGCAIEQDSELNTTSSGRLFCYLPMPADVMHGLSIHINGYFGLTDNRRDLKWLTTETYRDYDGKWNELLIKQVISRSYIKLIEYCTDHFNDSMMVYKCLPTIDLSCSKWYELLKPTYHEIANKPVVTCGRPETISIRSNCEQFGRY